MSPKSMKERLAELAPEIQECLSDDEGDDFVEVPYKDDWSNFIFVDNLPKIPMGKYEKLVGVLTRIFEQTGKLVQLYMPNENNATVGIAFIEFATPEEALKAVRMTDGHSLDKSHILKVVPFDEFDRLNALPEAYAPAAKPDFTARLNPNSWLGDKLHRDQYVVRWNNETEIHWAERLAPPTLEYGGEREKEGGKYWCEQYVSWSPNGSFLSTFHSKGVALWGGEDFSKQGRFAHNGVKSIEFSTLENYMTTSSPPEAVGEKRAAVVWDIRTRKELRVFESFTEPPSGYEAAVEACEVLGLAPPKLAPAKFKWSYEDKYTARRGKDKLGGDVIAIYETPSMALVDKKSLRAEGVRDFEWSPGANTLAYWAPESGNIPARVTLVELPSRKELRQKNLVNVSDCQMFWQSDGDYLCVKVLRHTKSKKTMFYSFELFRVNESLVPVEMLEMKHGDVVSAFAWEPAGHRFAVVHSEGIQKPNVSFYSMFDSVGKKVLTLLFTLEQRACNTLFWSPTGGHLVLAGLGDAHNGQLEFYDVDHRASKQVEHYRCTDVQWDPSGRIVSTCVAQPLEGAFFKFQMDNGFKLWNFQGKEYFERAYENFYQFTWRPRPKSLLDAVQKKAIVKNLRKYERRFAHDDRLKDQARQRLLTTEKRQARANLRNLIKSRGVDQYEANRAVRAGMRNGFDADDDDLYHLTTKTIETVISSVEEILK